MERGAERLVLNQRPVNAIKRLQGKTFYWGDIDIAIGEDTVGFRLRILSAVNQTHGIVVEHLDGIVSFSQVLRGNGRTVDTPIFIIGWDIGQIDVCQTRQTTHGTQ